jgi:hypothetical protein
MRPSLSFLPLALAGLAAACGSPPSETQPPPFGREVAPAGVLRGTVLYSGPHPCSANGHILGAAIIYVFERNNPPPPKGLATTPVNLGVVTGDVLFPTEPRNTGPSTYCPNKNGITETITSSAGLAISPVPGGEYIVQAFYDYTGDYLPNFSFSNLPEMGDIGGGVIDTVDALKPINAGNPNYQPVFLPVDVGIPQPLPVSDASADGATDGATEGGIPNFTLPNQGYIADNLTITVGAQLTLTRPYFWAGGMKVSLDGNNALVTTESQHSDVAATSLSNIPGATNQTPDGAPILTIPQDLTVFSAATGANMMNEMAVNNFESKLPRLLLHSGVPATEAPVAAAKPFHFQVPVPGAMPPAFAANFSVWQNALFDSVKQQWAAQDIPEVSGIPQLWPLVVLTKLDTSTDPLGIKAQGDPNHPVIVIQGITLLAGDGSGDPTKGDSLYNTATAEAFGSLFNPAAGQPIVFSQDHLTAVMRPAAICFNTLFDPSNPDKRGTLVTPHLLAQTADLPPAPNPQPIVPPSLLMNPTISSLVKGLPVQACLPTGRYAINVVYPDGQAWTVPNESGVCQGAEGSTNYSKLTCTVQPRPVMRSQGERAVVEVTKATDPTHCTTPLPPACLPTPTP